MPLSPGTKIGTFDVLAKLGEGGPPALAKRSWASYGGSTVATERTCE